MEDGIEDHHAKWNQPDTGTLSSLCFSLTELEQLQVERWRGESSRRG